MKRLIKAFAHRAGYEIRRLAQPEARADSLYAPWCEPEFQRLYQIAAPRTLVSPDRCYVLERLLRQTFDVAGDVIECGVFRGGTAKLFAHMLAAARLDKKLYLFDTFAGMPPTVPARDWHREGDFSDTSLASVQTFVAHEDRCVYRAGLIPDTFNGLMNATWSFAHIDVDIYASVIASLDYIWPRLSPGGIIVNDDYGFPTCPGARQAMDEFFANKSAVPLCLPTGQAVVWKRP